MKVMIEIEIPDELIEDLRGARSDDNDMQGIKALESLRGGYLNEET